MEHTKHIWRAVLVLVAVALIGIVVRHFLVPSSFGQRGHYRYDSLAEYMDIPLVYGGVKACAEECHPEQLKNRNEGKHATVSCEVCHMPLADHVKDGEVIAEMPKNLSHELCLFCHQEVRTRRETMPQISIREHLIEPEVIGAEDEIPEGICAECHDVHAPDID